ncbi:prealbumin-like fold domain-containing protein [Acinetobacter rathckeae]|uniref:prealbumin-like fold domain-containing protein n=1 Tax=Acinetobacter rathckeae TaxID=2605272 RepID=UPI0018A32656|nr:SdrD B-like domain-containing protein [Acinetobacter rathckeae]MBF7694788.1 DUF11 domain-containing protein [Acinetobacter rathckeae]
MLGSKLKIQRHMTLNLNFMDRVMKRFLSWVLMLISTVMFAQSVFAAPPTLEIYSGSGAGRGPQSEVGSYSFLLNENNPSDNNSRAYTPTTTVSYKISNSVYNDAVYATRNNAGNLPELMFGGDLDASNSRVTAADTLQSLNGIGSAANNMFAASLQNAPSGCSNSGGACLSSNGGIDVATNYGVRFLAMTKSLANNGISSSARVKMGTVEITFNRPVTNPIIQASGLGGTTGNLGFSAEFTLTGSDAPVTLQRIAGNSNFAVSGSDIKNTASKITASSASGGGGASGSVYVKGKNIKSLTFDVYLKGDGGASYTTNGGDVFFFGVSSMDADSDLSIVKSQRVGTSGDFVQTQLNVPFNSTVQYKLLISNNKPQNATVGGSAYLAPFTDVMPSNLSNVSIVGNTSTGTGTTCSPTLSGDNTSGYTLKGTFSGDAATTCTIILQSTASKAGTITNTASIEATSTDLTTTNDTSSVNTVITYPSVTADPTILEARFSVNPDVPTIERGRVGTQLINIKNEGPNDATNSVATYVATPKTGVTVASVSVVDGNACTVSGLNWTCPLGSIANQETKQLSVSYNTVTVASLGNAQQQATVKVASDEFNPGSGAGETLYKVWGTNENNEIRTNGAFWVGYTGAGGQNIEGTYANEYTSITGAWPLNQASPTGGYLVTSGNDVRDSVYAASSSTAPAQLQKVITNMVSDPARAVKLSYIVSNTNNEVIGDNRRAWEFTTGVYISNSQNVQVCMGNSSSRIDDSGYIMIDGVEITRIDGYNDKVSLQGSRSLDAGYHRITYRIANRNSNSSNERSQGNYGAIGLSLSGDCTTANYDQATAAGIPVSINIIDGAKIKIAKNSVNGTGTFNYINLSNLVNNTTDVTTDSVTTTTANTPTDSTQQLWAKVLNKDVSVTESDLTGYVLSGVSCIDANGSTTGNTGTFWALVNNVLTIPAERIKEGANITCTFTNRKLIYIDISGRVFVDNSGTTLDASKAYNGIQDTGEKGIADTTIVLNNCGTTQLGSLLTNANGDYAFSIEHSLLPASFCIVQQNLPEYTSVSGTSGYNRSTNTISLTKTSATNYTGNNFGDVIVSVVLNEDGQHTVTAGDVTDYPHRLTTQIPVKLTELLRTQTQQPNSSIDQPWQALIYQDTNCNGQVDSGESIFNPTTSNMISLQPNSDLCLVQRVHVPSNVATGAQHIGELQASYQFTLASPAETIYGKTNKRYDVTLIGTAGLTLSKKVRAVASCPSTSSDVNAFSTINQASKSDRLEYEITYKNNSTKKLQNVKVKDSLPIGTSFGSQTCGVTPSDNTCSTTRSDSAMQWNLTGLLMPAASGTLRFCVAQ